MCIVHTMLLCWKKNLRAELWMGKKIGWFVWMLGSGKEEDMFKVAFSLVFGCWCGNKGSSFWGSGEPMQANCLLWELWVVGFEQNGKRSNVHFS